MSCKYPSPVKVEKLVPLLQLYPKRAAAQKLKDGFTFGFKLGYLGERVERDAPNLKSVSELKDKVYDKLQKEIKLGRIQGPFKEKPFDNLIISPIGLVPKAQEGKYRMIHHLSYPDGNSVNDGIDRDYCTVQYASFDTAVSIVVTAGIGAAMAKADIESAFRLLPIHPQDFSLLGMKIEDNIFVDRALPMGASCSPALFETFSTFLEWAAKRATGTDRITHFADDFLLVGKNDDRDRSSCCRIVKTFENMCDELGVPLAKDKSVGPATSLVYLGLQIDSVEQTISIPQGKLETIVGKVQKALQASKLTLKELQSLIGSLSFVCKAIAPGRPFIRRLIDLTRGVKKSWHKIRLTKGAKSDLNMWMVFLKDFNGISIIPEQAWVGEEDLQLFTDASGEIGCGGFLQGRWFQEEWPVALKNRKMSIAWLEFFPLVVAIVLWGHLLKGKRIILRSDNEAVIAIINKQTSKCPLIMSLLRFFVLQCLKQNVSFTARHIPGKQNNVADALSRFQMARFWKEVPWADKVKTQIPKFLWNL